MKPHRDEDAIESAVDQRMFWQGFFWGAVCFGITCLLLWPVIARQWHLP